MHSRAPVAAEVLANLNAWVDPSAGNTSVEPDAIVTVLLDVPLP
jgi:hypothetical protein